MHDALEEMDPDDYVIALVQIPPGQDSRTLLDVNNPSTVKFLRKFLKKVHKKPDSIFSRQLPHLTGQTACTLSVKDSSVPVIPFVGKCRDGSWGLRSFPTRRFAIQTSQSQPDVDIPEIDLTESSVNSNKRSKREKSPSPQLIISSDEDEEVPVEQTLPEDLLQPPKKRRKN